MKKDVERLSSKEHQLYMASKVLKKTFFGRRDTFAMQTADGAYYRVEATLNNGHVARHLRGEITLGTYLLDYLDHTKFMVIDNDREDGLCELMELAQTLEVEGIPTYLEESRRGGHLWFFFEERESGEKVKAFGEALTTLYRVKDVEIYPKQAKTNGGYGSLIRLPFGIHKKSGKRYGFLKTDGSPLAPTIRGQIVALSRNDTVPKAVFETFAATYLIQQERAVKTQTVKRENTSNGKFTERIKKSFDLVAFIGNYVDLKETSKGAVGLCPFHEDENPSFGVSNEGFWHCFKGCGGGDVISFWQKYRGIDFGLALVELKQMLEEQNGNHLHGATGSGIPQNEQEQIIYARERRKDTTRKDRKISKNNGEST